jgi:hypothetical protein
MSFAVRNRHAAHRMKPRAHASHLARDSLPALI